jgi:hypothetical protein
VDLPALMFPSMMTMRDMVDNVVWITMPKQWKKLDEK